MEEEKIVIGFGFPSYWLYKNTFVKCCESFEQGDRGLSEPVPKVDILVVWFDCHTLLLLLIIRENVGTSGQ